MKNIKNIFKKLKNIKKEIISTRKNFINYMNKKKLIIYDGKKYNYNIITNVQKYTIWIDTRKEEKIAHVFILMKGSVFYISTDNIETLKQKLLLFLQKKNEKILYIRLRRNL